MYQIRDVCDVTLQMGDKEMKISTMPTIDIIECKDYWDERICDMTVENEGVEIKNIPCKINFKTGRIKGEYKGYMIEGEFNPDNVQWR